ncbi:alpha/beta hydrolase [Pseudoclavibacter chungangensis]|uniref:Alpha/beta hydrolase n=1 Tax=Pseudoclavibacter chungangensis TaxID=587635 RepID=A0A7J5C078_9MICO|nr:alpha/beta hydrolase [Pseudoclavibacter chungangensis]KAB1660307.1 alpha/beta hydrolase [Pseudoclavibacter chungangensis]NYJ65658.1 pimeloyl-ACP methyl ester carboxylesterase [Pseudoclavibacter chungangensis]
MRTDTVPGAGLLGEDGFVDAWDGRRLRTMSAGEGDDLVVLEAGLGTSGLYWGPVHARLARHARVVAYERAGYGGSSPVRDAPRDLRHLARDLRTVVDAFPHRRLVLVGHSWGGPIVRTLAARLLAEGSAPAGLVLVDQSDEHAAELYTSRLARWSGEAQGAIMVPLAQTGLLGRLSRVPLRGLPEPILDATVAASTTVDAAHAIAAEHRVVPPEITTLAEHPLALADMPMRVLSGQRPGRFDRALRAGLVRAHHETVAAHPGARFVPAERSAHLIPVTEPELIAREALDLLA